MAMWCRLKMLTHMWGVRMDEFFLIPLFAGVILALATGPLGVMVVWRRMAYFGDAMSHAALLGVAVSLVFQALPMVLAIFVTTLAASLLLQRMSHDARLHADTLLGVIAHGALAIGILLVAMSSRVQVDLDAYLFGNILATTMRDVWLVLAVSLLLASVMWFHWKGYVMLVLDPAMAKLHGVPTVLLERLLMVMLAAMVALAIHVVGVLMITAMLIIPAASARYLAQSPAQMAVLASVIGAISVALGLAAAFHFDAPPAPAMVSASVALFAAIALVQRLRSLR